MRCFMPFMPHDAWLYQLYQKLVVYIRPAPRWLDGYGSILRRRVVANPGKWVKNDHRHV